MSGRLKPVTLHILDKDYVVACPESESEDLLASADYLSKKMREIREGGKVVGSERLLVMTALNIVHELLQYKQQREDSANDFGEEIHRLQEKIAFALERVEGVE